MATRKKTGKKSNPLSIRDLPAKPKKAAGVKGGAMTKRIFKDDSCNSNTLTCKDTSTTNTLCCE